MHRIRIGSATDVCRVVFPLSPHGVMFVIIAPKVPHFVGFRVGQGRRDRGLFARRRPARGRGARGGRRIPEVFVGAMPSSTSGFEKRTPAGVSSPGALSYRTNRTSQTGRTARMTLGVYLGEIHLPVCRSRRGAVYRTGGQRVGSGEFFYRY